MIDVLLVGDCMDRTVVKLTEQQVHVEYEYRVLNLGTGLLEHYFVWPIEGDELLFHIGVHSSIEDFDSVILRVLQHYAQPTIQLTVTGEKEV